MILRELIQNAEGQMKLKLAEARKLFEHKGDKGTHVEDAVRSFFAQYLPRRYAVGQGEVIDSSGGRSTQIDVVVANEDHPFTFVQDRPGLFFVEGVSAVGEVKSILTSDELAKTIENSRVFKRLRARPGAGSTTFANESRLKRHFQCPPMFLLALESQIAIETIHTKLSAAGHFDPANGPSIIDAVFVLGKGAIIDFGDGKESVQFVTRDGKSHPGWQMRPSDSVLFDLFNWLSVSIPRMTRLEPVILGYTGLQKPPGPARDSPVLPAP